MCGIAGAAGALNGDRAALIKRMIAPLARRGPDAAGCWHHPALALSFGFRRLAVLDPTPAGNQPMHSPSGRFTIIFNGEIYNFQSLARELAAAGHPPAGAGDTAALLAAIEAWGCEDAVRRAVGMYAFAVWDEQTRVLTLARDRCGEKPLYYGWLAGRLLFGSDLRSLALGAPDRPVVSNDAMHDLLRFGYIPAPRSMFEKLYKLPPATTLAIAAEHFSAPPPGFSPVHTPRAYWSLQPVIEHRTPVQGEPAPESPRGRSSRGNAVPKVEPLPGRAERDSPARDVPKKRAQPALSLAVAPKRGKKSGSKSDSTPPRSRPRLKRVK